MIMLYLLLIIFPAAMNLFMGGMAGKFNSKTLYYGVRLPSDFELTDEMKNIGKDYKKKLMIYTLIYVAIFSLLFFMVPSVYQVTVGLLALFIGIGISMYVYKETNEKIKEIKLRDNFEGYTNKVVVDLNYRKEVLEDGKTFKKLFLIPVGITFLTLGVTLYGYFKTMNEMVPGVFGENGEILEYVKKSEVTSLWVVFMPIIFQFIMLIVFYLSYVSFKKVKQIINGGEVEAIKEYNRKTRKLNIYYLVFTCSLINILFMVIALMNTLAVGIVIILTLIITIGSAILIVNANTKMIKKYKNEFNVDDNIVNRDDDELYKWGMFYNNPKDPSFFVPKRVGAGIDLNYGNPRAKIVVLISAVLFSVLMIFAGVLLPMSCKARQPIFTQNEIQIKGIYGTTIEKEDIAKVSLVDKLPENMIRVNGAALSNELLGNFDIDRTYSARLFIPNAKMPVIEILKKDGSRVYINQETREETENLYKIFENYVKN